jgi:hypothetical protein
MARAQRRPVVDAFIAVLEGISLGGSNTLQVGDGSDPNHEKPYAVVTVVPGGQHEGPMDDLNADEEIRIQVTGIGETREQADWVCDKARLALTREAMDTELASASRKILSLDLDFGFIARDDRGLTEAVFVAFDQYALSTTPT